MMWLMMVGVFLFFFFFQAEDGIRDGHVTGVQTCALPISELEAQIADLLSGGIGDNEQLAELGRLGTRLVLQRAVEDEVTAFLGRARYERTPAATGSRHGSRNKPIQTAEGEITVAMPQVRAPAAARRVCWWPGAISSAANGCCWRSASVSASHARTGSTSVEISPGVACAVHGWSSPTVHRVWSRRSSKSGPTLIVAAAPCT